MNLVPCKTEVISRVWDNVVVAFDPLTGDTHKLSAPSGQILEKLLTGDGRGHVPLEEILLNSKADIASMDDWKEAARLLAALDLVGIV